MRTAIYCYYLVLDIVNKQSRTSDHFKKDLFSLYDLFSQFRPRDVPKAMCLLSFHELCIHTQVDARVFDDA